MRDLAARGAAGLTVAACARRFDADFADISITGGSGFGNTDIGMFSLFESQEREVSNRVKRHIVDPREHLQRRRILHNGRCASRSREPIVSAAARQGSLAMVEAGRFSRIHPEAFRIGHPRPACRPCLAHQRLERMNTAPRAFQENTA